MRIKEALMLFKSNAVVASNKSAVFADIAKIMLATASKKGCRVWKLCK